MLLSILQLLRERYNILLKRRAKQPAPWSEDKVFQTWSFCNVFREDDKVTEWVRKKVREPLRSDPRVLLAMATCRFFNNIPTLTLLHRAGLITEWNGQAARQKLKGVSPVTSAAYIIKTPNMMKKADGVCWIIDNLSQHAHWLITKVNPGTTTLESMWEYLKEHEFFGPFMSYEVVTDLRHTDYFCNAPDIDTWACPGPGACRGLSWIMAGDLKHLSYGANKARKTAIKHMQVLLNIAQEDKEQWPADWPRWEMRTVEHWLCEYAKIC